jgi:catechol 2,3-dioxygenase-like lactoylglutathione lyase family enzyme
VSDAYRGNRRDFLKKGAVAVGGLAALPYLAPGSAWGAGSGQGELGLVGVDHVGLTVPDIVEAVAWFSEVMGATAPLSFGPIADPQGTLMHDLLGVDPSAVISRITVLRLGHSANIELFEYEAPDQRRTHPLNSDWSGHHIAFYVTDIEIAVAHMEAKGVQKFLGPFPLSAGPAAGQAINYFKTPFGTYIELISYPNGMAYQVPSVKPLWSPKRNGNDSVVTTVPGLLGIDHVGITVPDVDATAAWLAQVIGATNPLTFGPFSDPSGDFMHQLVDVDPRAVVERIRMVRAGNGPGIELFQYTAPGQDHSFRKNSDWGAHHIAFYVRHIDKAVEGAQAHGAQKRLGPFPVTAGPAAGQTINYFQTPFGTDIELISYPHGMAYQETAQIPLWDPRDNHP